MFIELYDSPSAVLKCVLSNVLVLNTYVYTNVFFFVRISQYLESILEYLSISSWYICNILWNNYSSHWGSSLRSC